MKKSITILPYDAETETAASVLYLINEFKHRGFTSRAAFLEIVCEKKPQYSTIDGTDLLRGAWLGRVRRPELNADLESVLESLKTE